MAMVLWAQQAGWGRKEYDPAGFQWLALSVLGVFLMVEVVLLVRNRLAWKRILFRSAIWLLAAAAIDDPSRLSLISRPLGIDRPADLLLYLLTLTFLVTTFYFYSRCQRLEIHLTELARRYAISHAEKKPQNEDEC